ncbi:MAG TPA: PhoX family phosphatase [Steroidobacteraceae bacterium]|nr:PhoX family phosphatase [Steroidobacteraceae bacterium]
MDARDLAHPVGHDEEPQCNFSGNPEFAEVVARRYGRRDVVKGGVAVAVSTLLSGTALARPVNGGQPAVTQGPVNRPAALLGFTAIPHSFEDVVTLPPGYSYQLMIPEGAPITADAPDYIPGDFNSGADREKQAGAHHDGMWYYPLHRGQRGNEHGLLVVNHENIDPPFLHPTGIIVNPDGSRDADQVRKEIASHGVSVVELLKGADGRWRNVRGRYNRRITGQTVMELTGPVAGSDFVKTAFDNAGYYTRGTLNNCAMGYTPWGTDLTCEENWAGYFTTSENPQPREKARYGVNGGQGYRWWLAPGDQYERFDTTPTAASAMQDYRNEANCFGWVVEIDPFDPKSTSKKRTALGRFAHEGAWVAPVKPGRPVVVYSGDDSRGEYMYKFVSAKPYHPTKANGDLLDAGTLYVARFNDDGSGVWVALVYGQNGLTDANGFTSQADVLVNTRTAADFVGATRMDRPEWAAVDARTGYVYLTLTNNTNRGVAYATDNANPRAVNRDGHIIRWLESDGAYEATTFAWDIFVFGGPTLATINQLGADPVYAAQVFPGTARQAYLGEEASFNSPDGLWLAPNGIMWIETDGYRSDSRGFGNQQMLAADPETGDIRRFLTGPNDSEITGICSTPDGRTIFANIQHPGERGNSTWPNINGETRPRSATLIITKDDGGVVGT